MENTTLQNNDRTFPQGMAAVTAIFNINNLMVSHFVSKYAKTTASGNLPILVKEGNRDLPVEYRVHTAAHIGLRQLVGALGKMLDVEAIKKVHPEIAFALNQLEREKETYPEKIQDLQKMHEDAFGVSDPAVIDVHSSALAPCPYYRNHTLLLEQLEHHYLAHPAQKPASFDRLQRQTKSFCRITSADVFAEFAKLSHYTLKGVAELLANISTTEIPNIAKWFYAAAESGKGVINTVKIPPYHSAAVKDTLGIDEKIIRRFCAHLKLDTQLHHPAVYKSFEDAYLKARVSVVHWTDPEEIQACSEEKTVKLLEMLALKEVNKDLMGNADHASSSWAVNEEDVGQQVDPQANVQAAAMGCPFHQGLLAQNRIG